MTKPSSADMSFVSMGYIVSMSMLIKAYIKVMGDTAEH